jgi:hypothetical protein
MENDKTEIFQKISNYILATTFKMVAFCAVMLFLNIYVLILAFNFLELNRQEIKYDHWKVSGVPQKCEAIRLKCSQESYRTIQPLVGSSQSFLTSPLLNDQPSRVFDKSMYDSCVYTGLGSLECNVAPPQSFASTLQPAAAFQAFIGILVVVVGFFYSIKFYFSIKHVGWRRITIVIAPIVSGFFTDEFKYRFLSYNPDFFEVMSLFLPAFLVCIALPYLGAHFYKWIREGFTSEEETASFIEETFVAKDDLVPMQITQDFVIAALKVSGIFCVAMFMLLANPERTLQTIAKTFVEAVLLVGAVYLYRRFKSK